MILCDRYTLDSPFKLKKVSNTVSIFLQEFLRNQPFKGGAKTQSQTVGDGKGPRKDGSQAQSSSKQAGKERGVEVFFPYLCSFHLCPVKGTF